MKKLLPAFICLASPSVMLGCELAELGFLAADDALHYEFTQSKTVAALSRPLQSSGVLGLTADRELVWQTQQPLRSTLVISAEGLQQFDRNDVLVNDISNPLVDDLALLFLNLLSGNTAVLEAAFTHTLECQDGNWQLHLTPADPDLAAILEMIALSGAESVQTLSFRETRGDYTEITLSPPVPAPLVKPGTSLGQ